MPLTNKGKKIMRSMKQKYGEKLGERRFYQAKRNRTISGVCKGSK